MRFFLLTLLCIVSLQALSQKGNRSLFYKPKPKFFTPVNDFAGMFSKEEKALLSKKIQQYRDSSSNVIVVITQNTLKDAGTGESYQLEEAAKHYFNNWGIGLKEKNNGVLFFVVKNDRKIRIATGTGIEDILTNQDCQEIIDDNIIPHFKNKEYYLGLNEAIERAMQTLSPELYTSINTSTVISNDSLLSSTSQSYSYSTNGSDNQSTGFTSIVIIFFVVVIVCMIIKGFINNKVDNSVYNSSGGYTSSSPNRKGIMWFFSGLFVSSLFNNRNSSYNDHNSGFSNNNSFDSGNSFSSSDNFSSSSSFDSGGSSDGGSSDGGGASGSW